MHFCFESFEFLLFGLFVCFYLFQGLRPSILESLNTIYEQHESMKGNDRRGCCTLPCFLYNFSRLLLCLEESLNALRLLGSLTSIIKNSK